MKRLIKQVLAVGLNSTGIARRSGRARRLARPPYADVSILMYHRVVPDLSRDLCGAEAAIAVSRETFEKQMAWLAANSTVLPLSDLVIKLDAGTPLPPRSVVVTFDDGWRDNLTVAAPILEQYRVPATIYLSTDHIGSNRLFWFQRVGLLQEKLSLPPHWYAEAARQVGADLASPPASIIKEDVIAWLKQLDYGRIDQIIDLLEAEDKSSGSLEIERQMLSWDEVVELSRRGFELGSHGCRHTIFTLLKDNELRDEMERSHEVITERVGVPPMTVAYPNGNCNERVARAAQEAGYRAALSTRGCRDLPFELGQFGMVRIGMHEGVTAGPGGRFSSQLFKLAVLGPA